jgi:hypothetical protein
VYGLQWLTSGERRQGALSPVIINEAKRNKTRGRFLLVNAQEQLRSTCGKKHRKGLKSKGGKMLAADVLTEEDILGIKQKLIIPGSRRSNQIPKIYSVTHLPSLNESHPKGKLYMEKAQRIRHEGIVHDLVSQVMTISLGDLMAAVSRICMSKLHRMQAEIEACLQWRLGPLPDHSVVPCLAFQPIAIDWVGSHLSVPPPLPLTWIFRVLFYRHLNGDRRFMCIRGPLSAIQTDRREQLVTGFMQLEAWGFDGVVKWAGKENRMAPGAHRRATLMEQAEKITGVLPFF